MFRQIEDYKQELLDSFLNRSCKSCDRSSCLDVFCRLREIQKVIFLSLQNDNKEDYYKALEQIDFICSRLIMLGK